MSESAATISLIWKYWLTSAVNTPSGCKRRITGNHDLVRGWQQKLPQQRRRKYRISRTRPDTTAKTQDHPPNAMPSCKPGSPATFMPKIPVIRVGGSNRAVNRERMYKFLLVSSATRAASSSCNSFNSFLSLGQVIHQLPKRLHHILQISMVTVAEPGWRPPTQTLQHPMFGREVMVQTHRQPADPPSCAC